MYKFSPAVIKTLRELHGLTTSGLAKKIGISLELPKKWESGEVQPSMRNLLALANEFNLKPGRFFIKTSSCVKKFI